MESNLEKIRKEIEQLSSQETAAESAVYVNSAKVHQLNEAIEIARSKLEEESMNEFVYTHMVERMKKKDQIALEIKRKELEGAVRKKELILADENEKKRRAKESQLQSKHVFDSLMKNISDEQVERRKRVKGMEKSIRNKEENVLRREEREKHQRDIAETAAHENKDATEKQMRQNFMIHKLWNAFMRKKMEKEMKDSAEIDEAFKKIKTATGVNDVQEIVHKFLIREQTYSELIDAVAHSEKRIDFLKQENESVRERLNELKILADGEADESNEIVELKNDQDNSKREDALKKEKYYNVEIVNDLITGWARRVVTKVDDSFTEEKASDTEIVELFKLISDKVCDSLNQLQEEPSQKANLMNDFLTDDFVHKNIRVRPTVGGKQGEEMKEVRSYGSRAHLNSEAKYKDDIDEFNAHDLEDERKKAKLEHEKWREVMAKKQKVEEKKK